MNNVDKPQTSRRRPRQTPKGRQVDPRALAEIQELLGARPRRRDLLIEFLHLIQDRYGHISAPHLAALADEMKLAQAEVYEVATFYARRAWAPAIGLRSWRSATCRCRSPPPTRLRRP